MTSKTLPLAIWFALFATRIFAFNDIDVSQPPYNADKTGIADAAPAINNAIAAAQSGSRRVYFPAGTYRINSTITLSGTPVLLFGDGNGYPAYNVYTATNATTIRWGGAVGGIMMKVDHLNRGGHGLQGLSLDGNLTADSALVIDGALSGYYKNLTILGYTFGDGIKLTATGTVGPTCSWNTFENTIIETGMASHSGLWLTFDSGNACHNTFITTRIGHQGTSVAVRLGGCDNNTLINTFITRGPGGMAAGVYADATERPPNFPIGNVFVHLQAGLGGWVTSTGATVSPAVIYGYQKDNGQPQPVLNGSKLTWFDSYGNSYGLNKLQVSKDVSSLGFTAYPDPAVASMQMHVNPNGTPQLFWTRSLSPASQRIWDAYIDDNRLHFRAMADDSLTSTDWLTVFRTGITPTKVLLGAPLGTTFGVNVGDTPDPGAGNLTVKNNLRVTTPQTPSSGGAPGLVGTIAWDTNYIYVCVAPNTWKRMPVSSW